MSSEEQTAREWLEAHYIPVDGVNSIRGDKFCVGPVTLVDIDTLAPMLAAYAADRSEPEPATSYDRINAELRAASRPEVEMLRKQLEESYEFREVEIKLRLDAEEKLAEVERLVRAARKAQDWFSGFPHKGDASNFDKNTADEVDFALAEALKSFPEVPRG